MTRNSTADEDKPLGKHTYHDEVLLESGGGEWFFVNVSRPFLIVSILLNANILSSQHTDLRGMLYNAAVKAGVVVRANSTVTTVDPTARQVTLANGDVVTGDVIIGADGTGVAPYIKAGARDVRAYLCVFSHSITRCNES